ncbi:hypothetical protein CISIN_1g045327mg, partial [Citrus sinensis]
KHFFTKALPAKGMGSNIEENAAHQRKYKGIRRRKWGKWVSEIRVPGSQERLWLGSYATPEAAAMAHDVAFYCLRRPRSLDGLNFPSMLPASVVHAELSPKSVQKAASDAGMGVDAQMVLNKDKTDEMKMKMKIVERRKCLMRSSFGNMITSLKIVGHRKRES